MAAEISGARTDERPTDAGKPVHFAPDYDGPKAPTRDTVIPFTSPDGFGCNLIHVEGDQPATKGPVIVVHGSGVRANIFRAPVRANVVDMLLESGYDPWLVNWRASIDLPPNEWTLDQAAVWDHPTAVRTICEHTGAAEIKAVIHCQGSTSFLMSLAAGLLPQVSTVVSNAVSLHPIVPKFSTLKIDYAMPVIKLGAKYLDPQWGISAPTPVAKVVDAVVQATHHECDNPVCKLCSFIYGSGRPSIWLHANLSERTHWWLNHEFATVPVSFYEQMKRCVDAGHLVSTGVFDELPASFVAAAPRTDARFALFAGARNRVFLPESQVRSYEYLDGLQPGRHALHVVPEYSHLDVFMGSAADRDIFPTMLAELDKGA